jgi:hypothetical protein
MQTKHLAAFALAVWAGPWAAAQTLPSGPVSPSAPAVNPGAAQATPAAPLNNPINRNPVYRTQLPDYTPAPPDPRDSTTRPVQPPDSVDERDTVPQPPESAASAARRP